MDNNEKDYSRLIAAQGEAGRRLQIKNVQRTIEGEQKQRNLWAILTGVCSAGVLASVHFSGVNINEAINLEIQALNNFEAFKQYIATFTPAMWGSIAAIAISVSNLIKHRRRLNSASNELYDMFDNEPKDLQDIVEGQARNK